MNDRNPATPAASTTVEKQEAEVLPKQNLLVRANTRFPRATRVLAVIGGVAVVGTVGRVAANVVRNKDDLVSATDHFQAAAGDVASSVSTPDTDN